MEAGFLLDHLSGQFTLLVLGDEAELPSLKITPSVQVLHVPNPSKELRTRYLGPNGKAYYVIRPDQHIVARWHGYDAQAVQNAVSTAIGQEVL